MCCWVWHLRDKNNGSVWKFVDQHEGVPSQLVQHDHKGQPHIVPHSCHHGSPTDHTCQSLQPSRTTYLTTHQRGSSGVSIQWSPRKSYQWSIHRKSRKLVQECSVCDGSEFQCTTLHTHSDWHLSPLLSPESKQWIAFEDKPWHCRHLVGLL